MKQYRIFTSIIVMLGCAVTLVNCREAIADAPAINAKEAATVFFDDFSGSKLDTSKWNVETTGMHFNNELQAYVDSAATLSFVKGAAAEGAENGALVLQPKFVPGFVTKDGQKFDFISARINTKS